MSLNKFILSFASILFACTLNTSAWTGWDYNFDAGVGCADFPSSRSDTFANFGLSVATATANPRRLPGVFVNAIMGKDFSEIWQTGGTYTLSGEWRKVSGSQLEAVDVNLQFVRNFTESRSELFWTLNPYSPLYGWVWTRYQSDEEIKLFYLGDNTNWHKWAVSIEDVNGVITRRSVSIDGHVFPQNIPAGTLPKAWEGSFMVLLETTNMYTNCSPLITTTGKTQWRNVVLSHAP